MTKQFKLRFLGLSHVLYLDADSEVIFECKFFGAELETEFLTFAHFLPGATIGQKDYHFNEGISSMLEWGQDQNLRPSKALVASMIGFRVKRHLFSDFDVLVFVGLSFVFFLLNLLCLLFLIFLVFIL